MELTRTEVCADKVQKNYYDGQGGSWYRLASPFDDNTGERNIAVVYRCPNYKRTWYSENSHDIFAVYKDSREWGIRIDL